MKYLPTINLWEPGVGTAVATGHLRLQPGQWVRCGNSRPSRIVRDAGPGGRRTVWAIHPQVEQGADHEQYHRWLNAVRSQKEFG